MSKYDDIKWKDAEIYIVRMNGRDKRLRLAKPCESCLKALRDLNIKNIYYSTNEGTFEYLPIGE